MSVSLYFNVHVPYGITHGLRLRGVDVLISQEVGVAIGQCIDDLELIAHCSDPDEWLNHVDYLPLK